MIYVVKLQPSPSHYPLKFTVHRYPAWILSDTWYKPHSFNSRRSAENIGCEATAA